MCKKVGEALIYTERSMWPNAFFQGWAHSDKIPFYQRETRDKHFSTKKLKAKYQISKSGGRLVTLFRLLMFCRIIAKLWSLVFAG